MAACVGGEFPQFLRAVRAVAAFVSPSFVLVGALLERFESLTVDRLLAAELPVGAATTRRGQGSPAGIDGTVDAGAEARDAIERLLAEPQLTWVGRRRPNPVLAIAPAERWTIDEAGVARTASSDAVLVSSGPDRVRLEVPLSVGGVPFSTAQLTIALRGGRQSGLVVDAAAADAWSAALRAAAVGETLLAETLPGETLPDRRFPAGTTVPFSRLKALDHAALFESPAVLADSLVGLCWPAVFDALDPEHTGGNEAAETPDGFADLLHLDHRAEIISLPDDDTELTLEVRTGQPRLTRAGRVVEVDIDIDRDGQAVARLHERFVIRDVLGPDPVPAVDSFLTLDGVVETARRTLRRTTVATPPHSAAMEAFTGDHNPLHHNEAVAAVAGLDAPIVHGMWVSAAMQRAAQHAGAAPVSIRRWQVRFIAPLAYGAVVDLAVRRVGRLDGGDIVEVEATVDGTPVALGAAVLTAPLTVYAFPGQGIQRVAMGLDALPRSAAARAVWERADRHTIERLGFSILRIVRDNPTDITVGDQRFRHPDGVLSLTQFTQVAMATLASAQVAELREAGGFVPDAITCGHSVGEYNALAAVTGILALEDVLEVVYHRGLAMHRLVPRDAHGASRYRMAAVRPEEAGLSETELIDLVAALFDELGCSATDPTAEFLQIVNFNLRGRQYAIAGTEAALERLRSDLEVRRERRAGKGVYVLVPGIDVPFHSAVLRDGVDDFRSRLDAILPRAIDPNLLVGRYIPNLVPRLFSLDREFVTEIVETVPSVALQEVLSNWDSWTARPAALCRVVLLELLAWQFASPVRWIETQDLLFGRRAAGGLGVRRFVEIGLASQPTIESLARQSVARSAGASATPQILGIETARAVVFAEDADDPFGDESGAGDDAGAREAEAGEAAEESFEAPTPRSDATVPAAPSDAAVDDIAWTAEDGVRLMLSWWTKIRPDQLGASDSIEGLVDGASSRRNQLLMDLGKEFNLGVIDGAAEASLDTLVGEVAARARTYRAPGPVLRVTIDEQLRRICGPAKARPAAISSRLDTHWGLGEGWARAVAAELASATRTGKSVRGGELASLSPAEPSTAAELDRLVDGAVAAVAARRGVAIAPRAPEDAGGTLDAAAAAELLDGIWGPDGVLTRAGRIFTARHDGAGPAADTVDTEALRALAATVERELGGAWAETVAPAFDPRRTLVIDDRWAGEREDLFRLANTAPGDVGERDRLTGRLLAGVSEQAIAHARYFARFAGEADLVARFTRIVEAAASATAPRCDEVVLVTGASPNSIAAAVVSELLAGGATVIATSSRLDTERVAFFRSLYHESATADAALWLAPANLASFDDVDRLVEWITTESSAQEAGAPKLDKPALHPTLVMPFAAPPVRGELSEAGPESELQMRVLLWSVERLIAKVAEHAERNLATTRVVLPGSPNRGLFGGDGAYGEAKAAFDALVERSRHERWGERVVMTHAIIGWVRGTGLMAHNDALADEVERQGIRTWTPAGIARELVEVAFATQRDPRTIDLSGGLWGADIDLRSLGAIVGSADGATDGAAAGAAPDDAVDEESVAVDNRSARIGTARTIAALPTPPKLRPVNDVLDWPAVSVAPEDTVVIIGFGEVGPLGSARTRFDVEVTGELSPAAVAELAWLCGLIRWEREPEPGFYDAASGELVAEADLVARYHDRLLEHSGIRFLDDDGPMAAGTVPLLCSVFLDEDLSFTVSDEAEAAAFVSADPERTGARPNADGTVTVTRKAGTEIRVPRRMELPRHVGAQLPRGFDPTAYGIPADMTEAIDRVAIWNLVATVDAFIDGGIEPSELLRWVHPTEIANTQGTGIGGISAIRAMYVDSLLGEDRPNDILQEGLPNVVAAHVMQSYVGGYGAMVHPVAACATAAVSVEEAYDKIRTGRAMVVVAGGFDDFGPEGLIGFANMAATASSDAMTTAGIDPRRMSRANDRRRAGFVEGQGGGTIVVARGDVALELGLAVRGVIAWAGSFSDGVNTSIPAPGLGLIGAARGGSDSALGRAFASFGIGGDDIAVISKHDTSTAANDPNEAKVHEALATALGRDPEHPLAVISQKSVTGHAKGGAAAFQINGLCQVLESGIIPPNRSIDCVDPDLARFERLVWPTTPLHATARMRAGLVTSLGFGHVSAIVAIVHPDAFVACIPAERRIGYLERAERRRLDGQRRRIAARTGGPALYRRPTSPYGEGAKRQAAEAAMLVDPAVAATHTTAHTTTGERP
ncbi:MAG: acyltransferase domain-containing protein [Actinobacteria bacterium]|nr:acyltransferase domain-containing protein [Actinomycetota bacterium]